MSELGMAIGQVAPLYNLALVAVAVFLFIKLFKTPSYNKKVFLLPWKLIFAAVCVYIVEEVVTVLRAMGVIPITRFINGFFELAIIILFVYALLLQREHVQKFHQ